MANAIELEIMDNGILKISITNIDAFNDIVESWDNKESNNIDRDILIDLFEESRYTGNDWYVIDFALSDALGIAYGAIYDTDDQDEPNDYENVWFYDNYRTLFYIDLLEQGSVYLGKVN